MDETVKRARRARAAQRSREHGYRADKPLRSVGKLPPSLGGPLTAGSSLAAGSTVVFRHDGRVLPT